MTDRAMGWLWSSSRRARWISLALVAAVTLVFADLLLATVVTPAMRFGHDEFIFLGGGYRVYLGQRPHVDFHTPLGLVTPMLVGFAMKLVGPNASAIDLASVLVVLATTVWGYALAWRRLPAPLAAAYVLLIGAIGFGRYTLSFAYTEASVASIFNRYAYAVLSLLLLECLAPVVEADSADPGKGRVARALGGFSSGIAVALLFFIKVSYVAQAAVLLAMSFVMAGRSRERWIGVVLGAVGGTVAILAFAHTNLHAVLADYASGAASRVEGLESHPHESVFEEMGRRDSYSATPAKLLEVVRHDLWPFLALFGIAALVPTPLAGVQPKLAGRWGILALTALVVLSSIPIVFTNWQWGEIPTTPMFALILCALAGMTPDGGGASRSSEPYRFVAIAGLAFFSWGELAFKNYASVVAAWSWHETYEHAPTRQWNEGGLTLGYSVRLVAPPLKHLSIVRSDGDCRVPYPIRINDGTRLLEKLAPERPHVFVLDFSNPFPIALGFDPPRGDAMWWHLIATFNLQHALPAEEALADVDVVMDPKCPEEIPTHDAMKTLYGPYIDAHFDKVDESEGWILLRRRPTATP